MTAPTCAKSSHASGRRVSPNSVCWVERYTDAAVGHLEKNAEGRLAVTRVELRPVITWGGDTLPDAEAIERMHESAHRNCFITNSVVSEIVVLPA